MQSHVSAMTVGGFAAFVTAMLMLIAPIKHLSEVIGPLTRGLAALERGFELIEKHLLKQVDVIYHPGQWVILF
jgi:subfamily B ATP-binding cassette protein MsbA